jgi:uncharacterized protein
MSEQDRYIAGVPCWIDTMQPDPAAAAEFYAGLFGWDVEDAMPPGAPGHYFIGRLHGGDVAGIGSQPPDATPASVWNTYVWVEDADATAEKVRAAGGSVLMEPGDVEGAGRTAVLADPAGAVFCVWQAREHRGAAVVNEPGSLNFNTLSTRDLHGACAFYGAVFGWELVDVGTGSMWALPAYGDFLEQRTPGTRERMAEMGAPPRFIEVVAAAMSIPAEQADTPAHWSVTFAVEDADATAARAAELGGRVVVPPFDAPWVRAAVIADPQGATFVASQFVPENRDLPEGAGAAAA